MKEIRQQKKQPEVIRKRILEQATILVSQKGISGVSIQNIATAVGITKGGIFHHFPNKEILIEEMFNQVILEVDQTIEYLMKQDEDEYGKFTRAYVHSAFIHQINGVVSAWSAVSMTLITEPTFNKIWMEWLKNRLSQHAETDSHPDLELLRLAADGLWLQSITGVIDDEQCSKLEDDLLNRTYLT
ncbi:TetR/AcrR family transcriptional regulator [Acinetobacter lwoffii]|uniref:TetR/AcrR family transcriptional regulator n=2 Tax=Acinetobacter TaxID=469 RepID=UPI00209A9560|nr:TetR/AcrR family transcriptional regulator [Acinetobacter lwoffii]MCO8077924.1 TetR/AcrR family transcriptional regulator [Acinetobacter lwoffii]